MHNIGVLSNMDFYCNGTNSQKIIDFGVGGWLSEDERCGGLIVTVVISNKQYHNQDLNLMNYRSRPF